MVVIQTGGASPQRARRPAIISLDELERAAELRPPNWEDHAPDPDEVLALVRAVRMAIRMTEYGTSGPYWFGERLWAMFDETLTPFRPS